MLKKVLRKLFEEGSCVDFVAMNASGIARQNEKKHHPILGYQALSQVEEFIHGGQKLCPFINKKYTGTC